MRGLGDSPIRRADSTWSLGVEAASSRSWLIMDNIEIFAAAESYSKFPDSVSISTVEAR